jgi:hypothetical protein
MIFDAKSVVTVQGFGEKRIVPMTKRDCRNRLQKWIEEIKIRASLRNDIA